jgi:hypothetical protein
MFQDFICWVKCLFHDCTCYRTGDDKWQGNDDSDLIYRQKRLEREAEEAAIREKDKVDYMILVDDPTKNLM